MSAQSTIADYGPEVRSLRAIRLEFLTNQLQEERQGSRFANRKSWRKSHAKSAREISHEISRLESQSDATYERATRKYPLQYWWATISPRELSHHAAQRGIVLREYFEEYPMDGVGIYGMSGYGWFRIRGKKQLSYGELEPILGYAIAGTQPCRNWQLDFWREYYKNRDGKARQRD